MGVINILKSVYEKDKLDRLQNRIFDLYKKSELKTQTGMILVTIEKTKENTEKFEEFTDKLSDKDSKFYESKGERFLSLVCKKEYKKEIKDFFGAIIFDITDDVGCLIFKGGVKGEIKELVKGWDVASFSVFAEENVPIYLAIIDYKDSIYVINERYVNKIARGFNELFQKN